MGTGDFAIDERGDLLAMGMKLRNSKSSRYVVQQNSSNHSLCSVCGVSDLLNEMSQSTSMGTERTSTNELRWWWAVIIGGEKGLSTDAFVVIIMVHFSRKTQTCMLEYRLEIQSIWYFSFGTLVTRWLVILSLLFLISQHQSGCAGKYLSRAAPVRRRKRLFWYGNAVKRSFGLLRASNIIDLRSYLSWHLKLVARRTIKSGTNRVNGSLFKAKKASHNECPSDVSRPLLSKRQRKPRFDCS